LCRAGVSAQADGKPPPTLAIRLSVGHIPFAAGLGSAAGAFRRSVAQLARAPVSKTGGWGFESLHSCQPKAPAQFPCSFLFARLDLVSGLAAQARVTALLPAEKASAEATLRQAQVDLEKTVVYAGVSGRVEQFVLQVGDIVNPFMCVLEPLFENRTLVLAGH
jgi:hypothetical protein